MDFACSVTRSAATGITPFFAALRRRVVLRPVAFRADPALFLEERALLRAEPALRAVLLGREREDRRALDAFFAELRLLDPPRVDERLRAPPRAADDPFLALLRPPAFRADVPRLREPPLLFLPRFDPPRDDFLAAAMILAPS